MRSVLFVLLFLFGSIAVAQDLDKVHVVPKAAPKTGASRTTSAGVFINGEAVPYKLVDGRYYIAVDDLARALRGSLAYGSNGVSVTSQPAVSLSSVTAAARVRGTLTFYFNSNYGNKPDSGAEVWLIPGIVNISNIAYHVGTKKQYRVTEFGVDKVHDFEVLKHTIADGNGNFEFTDVPEGLYSVVVRSKHVSGQGLRDYGGKTQVLSVNARAGESADASFDFGISD